MLEDQVDDIGNAIQRQVLSGVYSGIVFALWAAMEGAGWKAEEYLVRVKDILEKIDAALAQGQAEKAEKVGALLAGVSKTKNKKAKLQEPGSVTAARLSKELYYLTTANSECKLTDLCKESRKKLEKLGEALQKMEEVNTLGRSIPEALLKTNTVLAARQSGYLLGDLAAEQQAACKAVNKAFAKWVKTVKK